MNDEKDNSRFVFGLVLAAIAFLMFVGMAMQKCYEGLSDRGAYAPSEWERR